MPELSEQIEQLKQEIKERRDRLIELAENGAELSKLVEVSKQIKVKEDELDHAKMVFDVQANDLAHERTLAQE